MDKDLVMLVEGIVSLIFLIVFFYMAVNISKLKKHFLKNSESDLEKEIEVLLFKGKKEEVLDHYYDLAFLWLNQKDFHQDRAKRLDRLGIKIKDLGGTIPEEMTKFIEKYK